MPLYVRHCRKVATDNLPLIDLSDEHQGRSAVQCHWIAVFCHPHKRVIGIHDTYGFIVHPIGRLPEREAARRNVGAGFLEIFDELRLAVKTVWNMVKYFYIVGQHVKHGGQVALVEPVDKLLRKNLNFVYTHGGCLLFFH